MRRLRFCRKALGLGVVLFTALGGCSNPTTEADSPAVDASGVALRLRTDELIVPAGSERYLCFAQTLQEDLVVGAYRSSPEVFVHHLVLARALAPEPEGMSECDVLFRPTWDPLFISGAGASELMLPADAGHTLKAGTQLVLQIHLLNVGETPVSDTVEIELQRATGSSPRPVSTYVFGTTQIALPPMQRSQAQSVCQMPESIQLIAGFPHMHQLGRSLRFERGLKPDNFETLFVRDPYDFDDQHIEPVDITLSAGDVTRLTCEYDNDRSDVIHFGESTRDEMCLFIAFALDQPSGSECATRAAP